MASDCLLKIGDHTPATSRIWRLLQVVEGKGRRPFAPVGEKSNRNLNSLVTVVAATPEKFATAYGNDDCLNYKQVPATTYNPCRYDLEYSEKEYPRSHTNNRLVP